MAKEPSQLYLGTMTGTSLDGVDLALLECASGNPKLITATHYDYPGSLRTDLLSCIQTQETSLAQLSRLDTEVGQLIADCCQTFLASNNMPRERIRAIGSHGQTLCHTPLEDHPNSIQIGNPNVICQRTGLTTVSDFRRADIAQGGQGAPLAPMFHQAAFQCEDEDRVIINIGGIANITYLPKDATQPIIGFDTGPGNALLDAWVNLHLQQAYDELGKWAAQGTVDETLLDSFLADPYFAMPAPKSTGKEYFNSKWINQHITHGSIAADSVQATLCELTVVTIAQAVQKLSAGAVIYLCGGGSKNQYLVTRLQRHLSTQKIQTTNVLGIDPQWIEAAAFAWLAYCRIEGISPQSHKVTGAVMPTHLGAVYQS